MQNTGNPMHPLHPSSRWRWPLIGAILSGVSAFLAASAAPFDAAGLVVSLLFGALAADILAATPAPRRRRMAGGMALGALCGLLALLVRAPAIGQTLRVLVAATFFGGLIGRSGRAALAGAVVGALAGGLIGVVYEVTKHTLISVYLSQVGMWTLGGGVLGTYLTSLMMADATRDRPPPEEP